VHGISIAAILPSLALIYSIFLPVEFAAYIGSFRIGAYRAMLILLLPVIIYTIVRRGFRPHSLDGLMLLVSLWLPVSFWMNYDFATGLEAGLSQTIDIFVAYMVGRLFIRDLGEFKQFLRLLLPGLVIVAILLMAESISGRLFVRETAMAVFGGGSEAGGELNYEKRLGLLRAYGPFTHPIHAGMFLASFLPLYFYFFTETGKKWTGVATSAFCLFALSSAGMIGLVLNAGMMLYDRLLKFVREINWAISLGLFSALLFMLQIFSQNGVVPIIYRYLTLNPRTGYYRTKIWEYASDDVWQHPWFGIGYEEYTRPQWFGGTGSIDAHYLAMAVKYGFFPAFLYLIIAIAVIVMLTRQVSRHAISRARAPLLGIAISLATIILILFTVAIWGAILSWFNLMLGIYLTLALQARAMPAQRRR